MQVYISANVWPPRPPPESGLTRVPAIFCSSHTNWPTLCPSHCRNLSESKYFLFVLCADAKNTQHEPPRGVHVILTESHTETRAQLEAGAQRPVHLLAAGLGEEAAATAAEPGRAREASLQAPAPSLAVPCRSLTPPLTRAFAHCATHCAAHRAFLLHLPCLPRAENNTTSAK